MEALEEMDAAFDFVEAEFVVHADGGVVVELAVGGHGAEALGDGPLLGGDEEPAGDAAPAGVGLDPDPFDIDDGAVVPLSEGSDAEFGEPEEAGGALGDKDLGAEGGAVGAVELVGMVVAGALGPEGAAHGDAGLAVFGQGAADNDLVGVGGHAGASSWGLSTAGRGLHWGHFCPIRSGPCNLFRPGGWNKTTALTMQKWTKISTSTCLGFRHRLVLERR